MLGLAALARRSTHPRAAPPPVQVEATIEEALAAGGWCDVLSHVPTILSLSDTAGLLAKCKGASGAGAQVHVLAGTCVVAAALLDSIQQALLEAARTAADEAHKQRGKVGGPGAAAPAAKAAADGGKKAAAAAAESDDDDWDMGGKKGKKGGKGGAKKGKGGGASGGGKVAAKSSSGGKGGGGQGGGGAAPTNSMLSVESLAQRVVELHPDTEAAGAEGDLPLAIATGALAAGGGARAACISSLCSCTLPAACMLAEPCSLSLPCSLPTAACRAAPQCGG